VTVLWVLTPGIGEITEKPFNSYMGLENWKDPELGIKKTNSVINQSLAT